MMLKVILVAIIFTGSGNGQSRLIYPMPDWQTCLEAVDHAVTDMSDGGDAEGGAVIFCAYKEAEE